MTPEEHLQAFPPAVEDKSQTRAKLQVLPPPVEPESRPWGKLRRAFSLKESFTELFSAPAAHSRPVDGIRAIATLWVILFHTVLFVGVSLSPNEYSSFFYGAEGDASRRWMLRGDLGVDLFFVISGFLITRIIIHDQQKHGRMRLGNFYVRRFMRLLPVYFAVLAFYVVTKNPGYQNAWANVLYVNNFLPASAQAMIWAWSLAIEEQFYAVFPLFWLLLTKMRRGHLWVLGGVVLAGVVLQGYLVMHHGFSMPFPINTVETLMTENEFQRYFDTIYTKPYARFGCLLSGVIVAYLMMRTKVPQWVKSSKAVAFGVLALGVASLAYVMVPRTYSGDWGSTEGTIFLTIYRQVFGIGVASIILLALSGSVLAKPISWVLSWRIFRPVAQLSYSAYLVHPLIVLGIYQSYKFTSASTVPVALIYLAVLAISLTIATAMYVFIERPIMRLRPA